MNYLVLDDFLPDDIFEALREYADNADFVDYESQGVSYSGIVPEIPTEIEQIIQHRMPFVAHDMTIFLRFSLEGMQYPHQVHSDWEMGDTSMMLYLNREEDCQGGTAFVSHKDSNMFIHPDMDSRLEQLNRDQDNPEKWDIYELCEMKPNRALFFPSWLLHRAEPIGGFGTNREHGRVVLTAFFNRSADDS